MHTATDACARLPGRAAKLRARDYFQECVIYRGFPVTRLSAMSLAAHDDHDWESVGAIADLPVSDAEPVSLQAAFEALCDLSQMTVFPDPAFRPAAEI